MKTRKILCLFLIVILTGCGLAEKDGEIDANENRLVGVLITDEPLDPQFMEDGKLFADMKKNDKFKYTFDFKNIKGYDLFNYCYPETEVCRMISSEGKSGLRSTDLNEISDGDKQIQQFSTTLYYTNALKHKEFYENPLYQNKDGKVFAGREAGTELTSINTDISTLLENSNTIDDKEYKTEITVNIKYIDIPDYFNIIEMNENHQIISTNTFKNNEIPDSFIPDQNTSYLIFEQVSYDAENTTVYERKIISKKESVIEIYKCKDEGICFIHSMILKW